ncbi:MAG: DUF881 domain-containing protein, partial [Catenulispora sp.]|nr:DUF881 domain-containing protein [Catenulispora sp.]
QQRVDALTAQAEQERNQVTSMQEALLSDGTLERLRTYEAATGLRKVTGDGVVVTLSDGPPTVDPVTGQKQTPSDSRVLYFDLRTVVNQLFADGAEAVSINGQRLTALSTIRAAGEAILVDFKPLIGPYKVSAIGPGSMEDDFNDSATAALYRKLASTKGMGFSVKQTDGLTLPAAATPQLYYATPLTSASPSPSATGGGSSPSPSRGGK